MSAEQNERIRQLEEQVKNLIGKVKHVEHEQRASKPYFDEWTGRMSDGSEINWSDAY